jgi:hypothetical protein
MLNYEKHDHLDSTPGPTSSPSVVKKMKVAKLREQLKNRQLDTSGLKPALSARLIEALGQSSG